MVGRGLGLVLMAAALELASAAGQSAADGSVQGHVYTNRYFKISLTLPPNLHAVDVASLSVFGSPGKDQFLLMAAREGDSPTGVLLLAEKVRAGSSPMADGQEFLRKVRKSWDAGEVLDGQRVRASVGGLTFEELDYETPKVEFDSAIVTRVGDYLLVFRCNATSKEELKVMDDAVIAMRHP